MTLGGYTYGAGGAGKASSTVGYQHLLQT